MHGKRGNAFVVGGGLHGKRGNALVVGGGLLGKRGNALVVGGGLPLQCFHAALGGLLPAFGGLLPEGDVAQDVFDILHIVFDDADFAFQGLRAHRVLLCEAARMQYSAYAPSYEAGFPPTRE